MVRFLFLNQGKYPRSCSLEKCVNEVASQIYAKHYHDGIFCLSIRSIARRLMGLMNIFTEGRKRMNEKVILIHC